jgi:hypothetical protein
MEILPASGPVKTQIIGKETSEKKEASARVQADMNYQITDVMTEFRPEHERMIWGLGLAGNAFKKVYYDEAKGRMVSALVLPDNLYIPYTGSSVMSECQRITHRVPMSTNDYRKAVIRGQYLDTAQMTTAAETGQSIIKKETDRTTGVDPTGVEEEICLLEFLVDLDIRGFEHKDEDGEETGIKLPYIVTIDEISQSIVGVRRNWKEGDPLFARKQY